MAENAEVGNGSDNHEDKTVEKLLSKNLNGAMDYLISNARRAFI